MSDNLTQDHVTTEPEQDVESSQDVPRVRGRAGQRTVCSR